ncbi:hypothetical protein EV180_002461 [Coemansia sp. RSA 518]|nr:hypothetical protein EV180_002461 [Coemansia sp. RSA 518]KAJ2528315.1 hypothetical protein IWW43_005474 [Coemansia sp. RSA 1935]
MSIVGWKVNDKDVDGSEKVFDHIIRPVWVLASDMVLVILGLLQEDAWAGEYESIHISAFGFGLHDAQHLQRLVVGQGISKLE